MELEDIIQRQSSNPVARNSIGLVRSSLIERSQAGIIREFIILIHFQKFEETLEFNFFHPFFRDIDYLYKQAHCILHL